MVADKYLVAGLRRICTTTMINNVKPHDVWSILNQERELPNPLLYKAAIKVLCEHAEELLAAPALLDVPHSTLVTVIQQDDLQVSSEMSVIEATLRWARQECELRNLDVNDTNLRVVMGPEVVSNLRFLSLSPLQFACGPGAQNWLTLEEKVSLYQCLNAPDIGELSQGLCGNKEQRWSSKMVIDLKLPEVTEELARYPPGLLLYEINLPKENLSVSNFVNQKFNSLIKIESDCWLVRLDIFSQVNNPADIIKSSQIFKFGSQESMYEEDLIVSIKQIDDCGNYSRIVSELSFKKYVSYNSEIHINFKNILLLKKNAGKYLLEVYLKNSGLYPCMKSPLGQGVFNSFEVLLQGYQSSILELPIKSITFLGT